MSDYCKEKHLAARGMLEAFGLAREAYYNDASGLNMAAYHACRSAVEGMLESYYMNTQAENGEEKGAA